MEPQGKPGMQGVFGILLIVGGIILVMMVLADLAGTGGISTANIGGGPTAPHVPGLVVQTGLTGATGSGPTYVSSRDITGSGAPAPNVGQPVQTGIKPCLFGFILC